MINALLDKFRPIARSIKYGRLHRRAQTDATKLNVPPLNPPVSFIFGCGRSGTTILGKLLADFVKRAAASAIRLIFLSRITSGEQFIQQRT